MRLTDNVGVARVSSAAFVGRAAELARLRGLLNPVLEGSSAVGVLIGDAGIGKSRCLDVFLQLARGLGARTLLGRCPPLARAELPYAPLIDAIRTLAHEPGADLSALLPHDSPQRSVFG